MVRIYLEKNRISKIIASYVAAVLVTSRNSLGPSFFLFSEKFLTLLYAYSLSQRKHLTWNLANIKN